MAKLTPTQADALREVSLHGCVFVRWPGGFWTWRGCPVDHKLDETSVPAWHVGVATIRALEKYGFVERLREFDAEWMGPRIITSRGLATSEEKSAPTLRAREIAAIVDTLHDLLKPMSPDERLVVFGDVMEGYCDTCGGIRPESGCTCMRDE